MWNVIARLAVRVALYAAQHPDQVLALVQAAKEIVDALDGDDDDKEKDKENGSTTR